MNPDPQKALKIAVGVTLFTKDGSKMGNAIVTKIEEFNSRPRIHIETDFGNNTSMFIETIEELFTLGFVRTHDEWWDDRLELIRKNIAWPTALSADNQSS